MSVIITRGSNKGPLFINIKNNSYTEIGDFMHIIKNLRGYLLEDEFQIRILEGRVNVVNYDSIGQIDSKKIVLKHNQGAVVIVGDHLVVSKLMTDEILITGNIQNIELR